IINVFTRLRYCTPRGRIAFEEKGPPGTQQPGLYPWYAVPGHAERDLKIVCGHWSALGLFIGHGGHAIHTGAVWGGKPTAVQPDTHDLRILHAPGRAERGLKTVCGHWSALRLFIRHGVHAIDTGAVWGGKLTALQLDTDDLRIVQVPGRDAPANPPRPPRPPRR